ncbi:hypothetical protein DESA109040_14055 [Deinococcus saxicola]|uniref:hypothetical protein n=1 Tax=Deinococcus saxicola TaxID=249406 RepID=UPI0039F00654
MTIAKSMGIEEFFALELYDAAADYLALLGITPAHPHGTPLHDDSPTPELRRREDASEGLGIYLGCVLFDMMEAGCHDPERLRKAVSDGLMLVVRAAHEKLLPSQGMHAQLISA